MKDYIPLDKCKKGYLYKIHSRNLSLGVYNGEQGFIGIREKFGYFYLFIEFHWDQGPPYGTVKPIEELLALPADIPLEEYEKHDFGYDWADDPITLEKRPVIRRDLKKGEESHGRRHEFVDEWADTKERLPDNVYPYFRDNKALFSWLRKVQKEYYDVTEEGRIK